MRVGTIYSCRSTMDTVVSIVSNEERKLIENRQKTSLRINKIHQINR